MGDHVMPYDISTGHGQIRLERMKTRKCRRFISFQPPYIDAYPAEMTRHPCPDDSYASL